MDRCGTKLLLVAILAVSLAGSISAQTYWMHPGAGKNVTLQIFKPKFDHGDGIGTLTSSWFFSGRFEASERVDIFVDIPVSNLDLDASVWSNVGSETLIGNPYLGIEARPSARHAPLSVIGRVGFRPPLASDEKWSAVEIGYITCFDRLEAFIPNYWSITFGLGHSHASENGVRYATNIDGVVMLPTEDGPDTEMFLNYNFEIWFQAPKFRFGAGFAGRWQATAEDTDFSEASVHQMGLAGVFDLGSFDPGFHVRIPIDDDFNEILDYVYGVSFSFDVK